MTGQERVNRMFERREQDRVPRHETFWGDTLARWEREGLVSDPVVGRNRTVLRMLGNDFHQIYWLWPAAFAEEQVIESNEETSVVRDRHGKLIRKWNHRGGTPEHLSFGCDSREAWEKTYKPLLLQRHRAVNIDNIRQNFAAGRKEGLWTFVCGIEGFEATRAMMGDVVTLSAMVEDPEWVIDVVTTFADITLGCYQQVLDADIRPDGLWIYGDMAYKTATMCSPAMYKELIWPQHKRLADWAHANGMKFIYHTDGNINGVLDLYHQAGFDCLQPLESKAGMDIRQLAPQWGKKFAFFGNIDVMVMASNDRGKIEEEIATKFAAGMANHGYAYHSDHSVPPSVSWQTYQFIMQMVEKYGKY